MRRRRAAFTLIEVLLVLVVLVIGAALVAPALTGSEAKSKLDDAAAKLETMWARARLDAMASGAPLVFRCELGGERGVVSSPVTTPDATPAAATAAGGAQPTEPNTEELVLSGVTYQSLQVAEPAGSTPVGAGAREGETSAAVVFHPDGATSDAEVVLQGAEGRRIKVTLRGLTGATRVVEVGAEGMGVPGGAET